MTTVLSDFEKRVEEIDLYFQLLERIIGEDAILYFPNKKSHRKKNFNPELIKVLKANLFLLLYNLAESSIKLSLTEIYDVVNSKNIKYKDVKDEIRKMWLLTGHKNFQGIGTDNIFLKISNLAEDIISLRFDSDKVISGNIDGRKIQEFAKQYGFSSRVSPSANNGNKLHQVKRLRNDLAHGTVSFAECGRQYTLSELATIKKEVVVYLRRILKNIEKYLNNEDFKI